MTDDKKQVPIKFPLKEGYQVPPMPLKEFLEKKREYRNKLNKRGGA